MNTEQKHPVDCLIPAAGLSSRMGEWKMMLPFGDNGQTILDCSIANALTFCRRVLLVTGHRGDELEARYGGNQNVTLVHNSNYQQGLFSSIQCGIRHLVFGSNSPDKKRADKKTEYLFITHGDMPFLPCSVFSALWSNRKEETLFPLYNGKKGHPVLLHHSSFNKVIHSSPDAQMKEILMNNPYRLIPVTSSAIAEDIDTPESYQNALIHFGG